MDPMNSGPDEYGQDSGHRPAPPGGPAAPRPPRDPLAPDLGQQAPTRARTVRLVTGDFLVTVNPVDGSEIEHCPPGEHPGAPTRYGAQERGDLLRAAGPPVPPGPAGPELPLLERQEERERLVRLLARGRSVRLTGPAGSGRSSLLDAVARDCSGFAPDGVVRLSGYHRTPADLLHALFAAVYRAPLHRPDRTELLALVHGIGAIVVLDDLEFGGAALEELLDAAPECAFLFAVTPDVTGPLAESHLEEVFLGGLGRGASLDLLERAVERPLTDEEANWAGDLWFESEGLPLRFVQAGALLRQRDLLGAAPGTPGAYPGPRTDEVFTDGSSADGMPGEAPDVQLPTLGQGAAPAQLLAERLSDAARATLAFAVALGGEVPHQAHLPALVGDTHADAAMGELAECGLLSPAGSHYRLAAGVAQQLEAGGYADGSAGHARAAAQHYAWWAGHPSVAPERAAAEADAVLAAMSALVPGSDAGHPSAAVLLARSAAPAFAAGLHWSAWERALRTGQEAARLSGEVAEEAYFHHELGVLALCTGNADRALAELEASIALRGALADKAGTVAGRRALALIADRSGAASLGGFVAGGYVPGGADTPSEGFVPPPTGREDQVTSPVGAAGAVVSLSPAPADDHITLVSREVPAGGASHGKRRTVLGGARRNLVAAGAGVLLAGVLGTVVTLGATSHSDPDTGNGRTGRSVNDDDGGKDGMSADDPSQSSPGESDNSAGSGTTGSPSPGDTGATGSTKPSGSGTPSDGSSSSSGKPSSPSDKPSHSSGKPPTKPSHSPPTKPSHSPSGTPSTSPSDPPDSPTPTPSDSTTEDPPPAGSPSVSQSAVRPSGSSNGPVPSGSTGSTSTPSDTSTAPAAD
ncbi:ATP-binding protein [Streptomyces sp. NBC_00859]|uniref:ATP-binding protein n=1 Tax=Streptomyces sp. NBC_00859 TaxID=2903682 RepID=UPI00386DECCB|nr:ATP-binding protein [Streptomyces sp. NBC_00859]